MARWRVVVSGHLSMTLTRSLSPRIDLQSTNLGVCRLLPINALRPALALVGERVHWEDGEGVFDGIDPDGAARVRTDAGVVSLHAAHLERIEV